MAAGGIVIREGARPLVAIVQRRRDGAWVLPKGKLKPNERPIAAARREVIEETGCEVRVHEFLGVISYLAGSGPKLAHFWRMQPVREAASGLASDIKAVDWLPLPAAIDRLDLAHEQVFLRNVGHHALRKSLEMARLRQPPPETALPERPPPVAAAAIAATAAAVATATIATAAVASAAVAEKAEELPAAISPARPGMLAWLARRWQSAIGWAARTG